MDVFILRPLHLLLVLVNVILKQPILTKGKYIKHLDLFSGIGGFALAADRVWPGIEHTFCDNDLFCQEVLKKHWPQATIYGDIRTLTNTEFEGMERSASNEELQPAWSLRQDTGIELLTGGFPCQPFSQAGRRQGTADDRYLWPEMLRVIREFHPRWIIGENVGGFVTWSEGLVLEQVHTDLESEGYEVQSFIIPAVAVNAPHRRDRVWIVAHSTSAGTGSNQKGLRNIPVGENRKSEANASDAERQRHEGQVNQEGQSAGYSGGAQSPDWSTNWIEVATRLCRVDDGIRTWVDGLGKVRNSRNARLKALGNAIVPQVAEEIMKAILINQ